MTDTPAPPAQPDKPPTAKITISTTGASVTVEAAEPLGLVSTVAKTLHDYARSYQASERTGQQL